MLTKIENPEVMTIDQFTEKYADNWFCYAIMEKEEEWMYKINAEVKAKVLFLADSKDELVDLISKERVLDGFSGGIKWGINVDPDPGLSIGGLSIE